MSAISEPDLDLDLYRTMMVSHRSGIDHVGDACTERKGMLEVFTPSWPQRPVGRVPFVEIAAALDGNAERGKRAGGDDGVEGTRILRPIPFLRHAIDEIRAVARIGQIRRWYRRGADGLDAWERADPRDDLLEERVVLRERCPDPGRLHHQDVR